MITSYPVWRERNNQELNDAHSVLQLLQHLLGDSILQDCIACGQSLRLGLAMLVAHFRIGGWLQVHVKSGVVGVNLRGTILAQFNAQA